MIPKRKIVYIVTSVFFSSLLFINATSVNFQNNSSARQVSSETYTNTLTNIPIDVNTTIVNILSVGLVQK